MNKTGISYLTHTWNPIAMRCDPVSEGCAHCWHLSMAKRHAANPQLGTALRAARGGGDFVLLQDEIDAPLRRREPAVIGVQLMGDLFHEAVPFEWIGRVMWVIAASRGHRFLLLTKRVARMRGYFAQYADKHSHPSNLNECSNVLVGASIENQARAEERLPDLLAIPGKHWLSIEPMLGPIDLEYPEGMYPDGPKYCCGGYDCACQGRPCDPPLVYGVDWVVAGCESGPGRRATKAGWIIELQEQCASAGVPFFLKQRDVEGGVITTPGICGSPAMEVPW